MKTNIKYSLLQASYWMLYCIGFGYVTYYLQSFNYSAGEIGIVTAVFGLLAAVIQTRIGQIADKSTKWNWKKLLLLLGTVTLILVVVMGITTQKLAVGVLFGCFLILVSSMMPLMNAACFYYQNRGISMDFGKARGFGSLSYALISLVLGRLTASFGTVPVIITGVADTALLLAVTLSLSYVKTEPVQADASAESPEAHRSGNFLKKYPAFVIMLIGLVLLLTFHNALCTYMLQIVENAGGNSSNMGTALSIAAVTEIPVMFAFAYIIKKFRASSLLFVCGAGYIVRCIFLLNASSVWMVYAAQLLQFITFALYASASVYYTNETMEESDKVTGQALMSGVATVGSVIGNLIGGWAIELSGIALMLEIMLVFTIIGTILVAVSIKKGSKAAVKVQYDAANS